MAEPPAAERDEALAFPVVSATQAAKLAALGTAASVSVGDVLYSAGDRDYDFFYLESAEVEIVRGATRDAPEEVVARHGAGRFLGELNLLTGQTVYLSARVVEAGRISRISPERFRRLMAEDPELSDVLLRAFIARRELLRTGAAARGIEIVG